MHAKRRTLSRNVQRWCPRPRRRPLVSPITETLLVFARSGRCLRRLDFAWLRNHCVGQVRRRHVGKHLNLVLWLEGLAVHSIDHLALRGLPDRWTVPQCGWINGLILSQCG